MRWFNDTSEDEKATDEFLAARIENVMQFEKFKAKAKEALSNFPAVCGLGEAENQNNTCHSRPSRAATEGREPRCQRPCEFRPPGSPSLALATRALAGDDKR